MSIQPMNVIPPAPERKLGEKKHVCLSSDVQSNFTSNDANSHQKSIWRKLFGFGGIVITGLVGYKSVKYGLNKFNEVMINAARYPRIQSAKNGIVGFVQRTSLGKSKKVQDGIAATKATLGKITSKDRIIETLAIGSGIASSATAGEVAHKHKLKKEGLL